MDKKALFELGRDTQEIKEQIPSIVEEGKNLLKIAEEIEELILEKDALPAFPVNIGINEVAAHYTPSYKEERVIKSSDLVKIDFGLYRDGLLTDTAISLSLDGSHKEIIGAVEKALKKAVDSIKPGKGNGDIGGIVEEIAKQNNYKPISNLTGHKIEGEILHAGVNIPNTKTNNTHFFKEGEVYAVEPFFTYKEGSGYVKEKNEVEIFSLLLPGKPRFREARRILQFVRERYSYRPFAERWIKKKFGDSFIVNASLKQMLKEHILKAYPVLVEGNEKPVAQAEHTIYIDKDGAKIVA